MKISYQNHWHEEKTENLGEICIKYNLKFIPYELNLMSYMLQQQNNHRVKLCDSYMYLYVLIKVCTLSTRGKFYSAAVLFTYKEIVLTKYIYSIRCIANSLQTTIFMLTSFYKI